MSELVEAVEQLINISKTEKEFNQALTLNAENIKIVEEHLQNAHDVAQKITLESELSHL